jgi:hypothetical protein
LEVVETKRSANGCVEKRAFIHQPIMSAMEADHPAGLKFNNFMGVGAFIGCGRCRLRGVNKTPKGKKCGMHHLGYNKPTKCGLMVPNAPVEDAFCGDASIRVDIAMQVCTNSVRLNCIFKPVPSPNYSAVG